LVGRQVERQIRAATRYGVNVRLHDGTDRTFSRDNPWGLQNGDRVRVIDGQIVAPTVRSAAARRSARRARDVRRQPLAGAIVPGA
jgi:hypothetical protein